MMAMHRPKDVQPVPVGPCVEEVACPFCGAPAIKLLGMRMQEPRPIAEGADPTPEEIAAHLQGHRFYLQMTCCACQRAYQTVYWQQPQQALRLVLCDAAGTPVQAADLLAMRARTTAVQSIIVPGRRQ